MGHGELGSSSAARANERSASFVVERVHVREALVEELLGFGAAGGHAVVDGTEPIDQLHRPLRGRRTVGVRMSGGQRRRAGRVTGGGGEGEEGEEETGDWLKRGCRFVLHGGT